jgi:hypothetical protein
MKTIVPPVSALLSALLLATSGCSTIITGGRKEVNLRSEPSGARVAITDEKGKEIYQGTTPTIVTLRTGKPYFAPKKYTVSMSKEGFAPAQTHLRSTMSGWYLGNFIFGGLLGLVIIDPLTGAMYTLPKEHMVNLQPASATTSSIDSGAPALQFKDLREIPDSLRHHLVRIN